MDIQNPAHYIGANNYEGACEVFQKYGMPTPQPEEMAEAIDMLYEQHGQPAMNDLLAKHPDTQALLDNQASASTVQTDSEREKENDKKFKNGMILLLVFIAGMLMVRGR